MRSVIATGLVVLVAAKGSLVFADPDAPQVSPLHGQREDAQRLWEQLRGLDRVPSPDPARAASPKPSPVVAPSPVRRTNVEPAHGATVTRDKPLPQRWWFWAAIGAAAAVTIGVTYEATRGSDAHLPGVTCDAAGCRP